MTSIFFRWVGEKPPTRQTSPKNPYQELEREACEELQREDGLRSPSGVEFTLLDVPGGQVKGKVGPCWGNDARHGCFQK